MSVAYILGAGFSYAVSDHMPLMRELSDRTMDALSADRLHNIPGASSFRGDFEAWLTHLSTEQPWLTQSDNLRNSAAFYDVAEAVASVIDGSQSKVFEKAIPAWLLTLLHHWDLDSSNVITFNYDEIVEGAAGRVLLDNEKQQHNAVVYPVALTPLSARVPSSGLSIGAERRLAFKLLKLHGSVNWYYSGFDAPHGDTVYVRQRPAWRPRSEPNASEEQEGVLLDKSPLIVPPTAVKSMFYGNDTLRAQWRMAAEALRDAEELHIIGYSAPDSDLLVRALIGTSFRGQRILAVDPQRYIARRLRGFIPADSNCVIDRVGTVYQYVRQLPRINVKCTSEDGHAEAAGESLLELSSYLRNQLTDKSCPLCPTKRLTARLASQGQHPGFSCDCCRSHWTGNDALYYVRGPHTILDRDQDGQAGHTSGPLP